MTADNHMSRGSPLISTERQRFPPGKLVWAASWLMGVGQEISEGTDVFCDVKIY